MVHPWLHVLTSWKPRYSWIEGEANITWPSCWMTRRNPFIACRKPHKHLITLAPVLKKEHHASESSAFNFQVSTVFKFDHIFSYITVLPSINLSTTNNNNYNNTIHVHVTWITLVSTKTNHCTVYSLKGLIEGWYTSYTLLIHFVYTLYTLCTHFVHTLYTLCTHFVHTSYTLHMEGGGMDRGRKEQGGLRN